MHPNDQVSFVIRQSQLRAILREEGQCGRQLISIWAVSLRKTRLGLSRLHLGLSLWGGLRLLKLLLNDLGRTDLGDKGIPRIYDDTFLQERRDLEAISVFDPSRISRDASDSPTTDGIEEAHLAPDLHIIGIIHSYTYGCPVGHWLS